MHKWDSRDNENYSSQRPKAWIIKVREAKYFNIRVILIKKALKPSTPNPLPCT